MERERRPPSGFRRGTSPSSSSPPSRLTRSAARRTAGAANGSQLTNSAPPPPPPPPSAEPQPPSRKRKAAARDPSPEQPQGLLPSQPARGGRSKRSRVETEAPPPAPRSKKGKAKVNTSMEPSLSGEPAETNPTETPQPSASGRGKSGRKNTGQAAATPSSSRRTSRKSAASPPEDVDMEEAPEGRNEGHDMDEDSHDEGAPNPWDEDEEDDFDHTSDPFRGIPNLATLRALTGMYGGQQAKFRKYLEQLKSKDPSLQFIALQELSETLLMANEDTLSGNFPTDAFVRELVALMEPSEFGEENPNMMLLACRCLANLMEALPAATANIVYGGAVPVLCSTLLQMQFIDVAEQCLSTLEKISGEFPASIVREGGLSACLSYLEFFHTSTQRTAVTTAANCCRNIPEDSFDTVRDVMPILKNILSNSDQKVVEQGCICISRIVQSFRHYEGKLEELVSPDLLEAILRLLVPGTTNLVGENIHTMFLQVLAYTARASPSRSAELFKMNIVETLFQILTGVSPPPASDDTPTKIDSVMVMQALIHRPKDQVYETLNVICELLPDVPKDGLHYLEGLFDAGYPGDRQPPLARATRAKNEARIKLLEGCKPEVKRFAVILFPTLTDAYSSTVNLGVRQKVLTAQLKMLSNLDVDILEEALRTVPYASYLAAIFSQQDHPSLVTYALQAAEILLARLGSIYRYQFYREGVISQISALADRPLKNPASLPADANRGGGTSDVDDEGNETEDEAAEGEAEHAGGEGSEIEVLSEHEEAIDPEHDEEDNEHSDPHDDDTDTESDSSSGGYITQPIPNIEDIITLRARKFIELHENESVKEVRESASKIMEDLKTLANDLRKCVVEKGAASCKELFTRLAAHFDGDALDGITTYELMTSGIVDVLLEIFEPRHGTDVRSVFLEAFMGPSAANTVNFGSHSSPETPFSVLVSKLQDLLSRAEHFEVVTVHQSSYDNRASAASVLTKQVRLKLIGDEESGVPKAFRNILVSIHAIATFKALDDYLRPRFSIAERPRASNRDTIAAYAAALAGGRGLPLPQTPPESRNRSSKKSSKSKPSGSSADAQAGSSSGAQQKPRRSSRRQQTQAPPPPPPPPPAPAEEQNNPEPLECADEERLSDEDSLDEQAALNALVDDLDDAMEEDAPDPSAVNVEVASTGKVTARKEDGTRIATPVQGTPVRSSPAERAQSALRSQPQPSLAGGAGLRQALGGVSSFLSQAAAAQAMPSDFHIEFSINGRPIPHNTTIYRAVHFSDSQPADGAHRAVWNAIHTIKVRRVPGPPPAESSVLAAPESFTPGKSGMPQSLDQNPVTSGILRLLSILHGLNCNLDDVILDKGEHLVLHAEPLSQFVNPKLTAKLNRQLEEPLIVASNCLPNWSQDLARYFPFLFPFETRYLFLQSTAFGYSRAMNRWQNSQAAQDNNRRHRDDRTALLGRLQRQKIRVSRLRILESALKVMESFGSSPAVLEIEYFDEVGTGLGPTLEFYSSASKEFSKRKLKLWRENETNEGDEYAFGKRGLFPAPMSAAYAETEEGKRHLQLFKMLGKFVARSMIDSRIIDVSFNPTFFRIGDGTAPVAPSLGAVKSVDQDLARSLKLLKRFAHARQQIEADSTLSEAQKTEAKSNITIDGARVEDLSLDFTVPGYPIELVENGEQLPVTIDNVDLYVEKVIDFTLGCGVQRQVDAFRAGFSQVFDYSSLKAFTPDELVMLFGRVEEDWSVETLMDAVKADHGYNLDSKTVRNLLQVMSEYSPAERREFLQFITGSPKLPIGGFKKLTPMFTVVCKRSEAPLSSDDYLPSVMTCVNYLKMPDYSTIDVLREKLAVAIKEGQGAFHLS